MLSAALLLALPAFAATQDGPPKVGVELVADVTGVAPGTRFDLAVVLTVPEPWHVYWRNPGDSGVPTEVKVRAPEGFEVGPVRYPAPERIVLPGDIVCYVYEREVALFVPLTAPETLAAGAKLEFAVEASWLVCKEACFLGRGEARLVLPRIADVPPAANAERLAPHRARLPRPWKELRGASVTWSGEDSRRTALIDVEGARALEFFPAYDAPLELEGHAPRSIDGDAQIALELAARYGDADPRWEVHGVLQVTRAKGEGEEIRFYAVALAAPGSDRTPH